MGDVGARLLGCEQLANCVGPFGAFGIRKHGVVAAEWTEKVALVSERGGPGMVARDVLGGRGEGVHGRLEMRFERVKARNGSVQDKDAG